MQFYQLAIGAKFIAHGTHFTKASVSLATAGNIGYLCMGEMEVEPDGEPLLLLPPEEAEKRKPDPTPWTDHMARAPGYEP